MGVQTNQKRTINTQSTNYRLNMHTQKHSAQPGCMNWSCAHGKLPMYSVNTRTTSTALPPFLMINTTKQMRPNGRGSCRLTGTDAWQCPTDVEGGDSIAASREPSIFAMLPFWMYTVEQLSLGHGLTSKRPRF